MKLKFVTDVDLSDSATNAQILQQVKSLFLLLEKKKQTNKQKLKEQPTYLSILSQLRAKLTSQGLTDIKLQWNIQPKKQENEENSET